MGRIPDDHPAERAASTHSLHSLDDDLPPPYTDEPIPVPPTTTPSNSTSFQPLRLVESAYALPGKTDVRPHDSTAVTFAPTLSRDSDELHRIMRRQMKLPMRPLFSVRGTHTVSSKSNDKKDQQSTVTDFDFQLDLAETMLTGWEGHRLHTNWVAVDVLKDDDNRSAYRGGILRSRTYKAPARRRAVVATDDSEDSDALLESGRIDHSDTDHHVDYLLSAENDADLKLWCERFCDDPAPVKSFTLHRHLKGFSSKAMRDVLASHIRSLNYRGSLSFSFSAAHCSVTIYSPHWINRLRANRYIWWIAVILQLWIIAWPVIFLLEKRYEVVHMTWNASLESDPDSGLTKCYAKNRDETALAEYWAPAVKQAAWARRRGEADVLTRLDVERVQGMSRDELLGMRGGSSDAELERRDRVNRGEAGFVDNVVGLVRGIGEVRQDWRLSMGWGANC